MKRPLQVTLQVREPSKVELTVGEKVQLDRLVTTPSGPVAERAGALLQPGPTTVALDPGFYFFKTLTDAHLRVVTGGVESRVSAVGKDPPPPPPPGPAVPSLTAPAAKGDELPGELPAFTVA